MATTTNGIATKAECNSGKYVYAFSTSEDLTQCPTKSELESAGLTVPSSYTDSQSVKYSDITMPNKDITFMISNTLASKANLETATIYVNGVSVWNQSFDGIDKNGSVSWTVSLPTPAISKTISISVTIGEAVARRHWWYADNCISTTWTSISDSATTISFTITNDYAEYFKNVKKIRFHIGNDSDGTDGSLPSLSW